MKYSFRLAIGLCRVFLFLLIVSCQSVHNEKPSMDWADVTLNATGVGLMTDGWSIAERIQAIQRAKMDVYTQLESQIMEIETDTRSKIADLSKKDETLQLKITAFIRGAKIIRTENDEKGVVIVAELFLGEGFKATVGLAKKRQKPVSNQAGRNPLPR